MSFTKSSRGCAERARERLVEFGDRVQFFTDLIRGRQSGIYFSNELLDAFPVHRVVKTRTWTVELYVSVDSTGAFEWTTGPLSTPRLAEFCSTLFSSNLRRDRSSRSISKLTIGWPRLRRKLENGFVITVDYGAEAAELYDSTRRPQGTLRAFSRHGFVDDVLAPGRIRHHDERQLDPGQDCWRNIGISSVELLRRTSFY